MDISAVIFKLIYALTICNGAEWSIGDFERSLNNRCRAVRNEMKFLRDEFMESYRGNDYKFTPQVNERVKEIFSKEMPQTTKYFKEIFPNQTLKCTAPAAPAKPATK